MVMSNSKLRSAVFQQSHFLGVLIPEDLTLSLEDCRRYMNEAYLPFLSAKAESGKRPGVGR